MTDTTDARQSGAESATEAAPPLDVIMRALAVPRRRHVLTVLSNEGRTDVPSLATAVARLEARDDAGGRGAGNGRRSADGGQVTPEHREDVHVALHHVHVPKLDDAGLVDYDREARTVATTEWTVDPARAVDELTGGW